MFIDGWFELLARIILIAKRDAERCKDPMRRMDAEFFLRDFLEGVSS